MSGLTNMPNGSLYRYQELSSDDIRVLKVFPGKFGDQITAHLSHTKFNGIGKAADAAPGERSIIYEALSYAWGRKVRSHRLECVDGTYLAVTESLHLALQYLRYEDRERYIWADAVCINQSDLLERGRQVSIMADIFRAAIRVLVWLGEANPSDTVAFATLHASDSLANILMKAADDGTVLDGERVMLRELGKEPWCPCCRTPLPDTAYDVVRSYNSVNDLLARPWFSRLWVFQEVACARSVEVHCGPHHRDWQSFLDFQDPWYSSVAPSDIALVSLCRYMATVKFDVSAFVRLLVLLAEKKCEERQDRIYAIRSIAGLEVMESLRPDYTIAPVELYRRAVIECLQNWGVDDTYPAKFTCYLGRNATASIPYPHASLMLALASIHDPPTDEEGEEGRPSWAPAFNRLSVRALAKYYEYSWHLSSSYLEHDPPPSGASWVWKSKRPCPVNASLKFHPSNPNVITILGERYGIVKAVLKQSESPFAYQFDRDTFGLYEKDTVALNRLFDWVFRCAEFIQQYGYMSAKDFKELMCCCSLITGFDDDIHGFIMEDEPQQGADRNTLAHWVLREFLEPEREDHYKKLRYYDHFRNLALIQCEDGSGHFGWIPQAAEEGDGISLLKGCPRPFVLRQQDDGSFKLLGDSWIFGIADSASLDIPEWKQEWFSLS